MRRPAAEIVPASAQQSAIRRIRALTSGKPLSRSRPERIAVLGRNARTAKLCSSGRSRPPGRSCRAGCDCTSSRHLWPEPCICDNQRRAGEECAVFDGYDPRGFYCEMLRCPGADMLRERFAAMSLAEFAGRMEAAERALHALGVTFTVYSDGAAIDRILPFDAIPRVIPAAEWRAHRERRHSARHRAQSVARRPLSPADDPARRGPAERPRSRKRPFSSADARCGGAAQGLRQYLRHRHHSRRRWGVPRSRRQCPHPVGGQLRDREPQHDAARLSRFAERDRPARDRRVRAEAGCGAVRDRAADRHASRRSCCCRPAPTTRPISSMFFWRATWACRSSRGATSSSRTSVSICARSMAWRAST